MSRFAQEIIKNINEDRRESRLSAEEDIAVREGTRREQLEEYVKEREGKSPEFGGGVVSRVVNPTIDVVGNVGQDLAENASSILYDTIKGVRGPEQDILDYRLTKFADPSKQTDLSKTIARVMEEEDIGDKEALELIRKRRFLAEDPTRTEETYRNIKIAEELEFYNNWTDKAGILSAIIPPPRKYGEFAEEAYKQSDYVKKYKLDDPEGIGGEIVLVVGKLAAAYKFLTTLKNPLQASKSYKTLQKELGKTRAVRIKKLADAGKLGKYTGIASRTTTAAGKLAVAGALIEQVAFDPRETNFADLVANIPKEYQNNIVAPIVSAAESLQDDPNDSQAEARLKSAVATATGNVFFGPLIAGVFRATKAAVTKGVEVPKKLAKVAAKTVEKFPTKSQRIKDEAQQEVDRMTKEGFSIDPEGSPSSITDELFRPEREYSSIPIRELDDININFDKIEDSDNFIAYVKEIVEELKKSGQKFNQKDRQYKSWQERTEATLKLIENNPDESIIQAINKGMLDDELALAVRVLLVGAERSLTRARNIVLKASDEQGYVTPQQEALLIQASARFVKVLTAATKAASTGGRILDSYRQVVGGSKLKKTEALVRINKDLIEDLTRKNVIDRTKNLDVSRSGSIIDFAKKLEKMQNSDGGIYNLDKTFNDGPIRGTVKRLTSILYAGVLSDPATALVNFVGSGLHQAAETASRVISYPIGLTKAAVGKAKLFGYEGPEDRVRLGQLFARTAGGFHGALTGFVQMGRAFLKGDMLESLKEGDFEIDRLARTSGFAPISIETGTKAGKPFIGLSEQTKEAFKDLGSSAVDTGKDIYNAIKYKNIPSFFSATGNAARFTIKGVDIGLGSLISVPMRVLIGGDAMMKQVAKTAHLYEEAYVAASKKYNPEQKMINFQTAKQVRDMYDYMKEYVSNPSAEAYDRSLAKAAIDTFTNTNILADKIQDIIGKPGDAIHFMTRPYIPFVQTVTNLYDRALFYSPLSPVTKRFREDITQGGEIADLAVARMAAGTALVTMGYQGASSFIQTYMPQAKERDLRIRGTGITTNYPYLQTRKAAGWHATTVELTDPKTGIRKAHTFNRLDPFAMQFSLGADIYDIVTMIQHSKDEQAYFDNLDVLSAFTSALGISAYKNIIERNPLLQGLEAFGSAFLETQRGLEVTEAEPGSRAAKAIAEPILSIFSNALGRRIDRQGFLGYEQIEDPLHTGYLRDTYLLGDQLKMTVHETAAVAGFGEWSKRKLEIDKIPYKINLISGEIEIDEIAQSDNFWRQLFSISKTYTIKNDAVSKELAALNFSKRRPAYTLTLDNQTEELDNGLYYTYQKSLTDSFREKFSFYMRTPSYQKYREEGDVIKQKEVAQKAWEEALDVAKRNIFHIINAQRDKANNPYATAKDREVSKMIKENQRSWTEDQ